MRNTIWFLRFFFYSAYSENNNRCDTWRPGCTNMENRSGSESEIQILLGIFRNSSVQVVSMCGENKIWRLFSKFWRLRLIPEVSVQKIWNMFHMYFWIWKKIFQSLNLFILISYRKNSSLLCIPHHVFFVPSLSADLYPQTVFNNFQLCKHCSI